MIIHGECLAELKKMESNSMDSLITDPPAGIAFMGKDWDKDKGARDAWIGWMQEIMSGSTCVAAKRLNFEFLGIEQSEEYYKIAEKRLI